MLIRVIAHFTRRNSHGIDELIRIDGLPEDMIFYRKNEKTYLKAPWERDIDANIPVSIREHCSPVDITEDLPKERNEVTGVMQEASDTRKVLGLRLSLDNQPGIEMWKKIERIIDKETPRDAKLPFPVAVAFDQKSDFALSPQDIPVVIIRQQTVIAPTQTVVSAPAPEVTVEVSKPEEEFTCGVCKKVFRQQRGLWMHERKMRHKAQEPVAV